MIDDQQDPPRGPAMQELLSAAKAQVMADVSQTSAARKRRFRLLGASVVAVVGLGGVTAVGATGFFGDVQETHSTTADIDLGPAPKGSTYVQVTLDLVCEGSARYEIDLDHADNPASLTCGKRDDNRPSQLREEFELIATSPDHTVTITTNVKRKYVVRAHYGTGLSEQQRFEAAQREIDRQRDLNGRLVERTTKVASSNPFDHPAAWPDPYYVNENGMTIGTFTQVTPYDQRPDLVPRRTPDGREAFVYSSKRNDVVKNPKQAGEYMDWLVETGQLEPFRPGRWRKSYVVYLALDGKTMLTRIESGSVKDG